MSVQNGFHHDQAMRVMRTTEMMMMMMTMVMTMMMICVTGLGFTERRALTPASTMTMTVNDHS